MNKIVSENLAFGAICSVARRWPTAVPRVAKLISSAAGDRELALRVEPFAGSGHLVQVDGVRQGGTGFTSPVQIEDTCVLFVDATLVDVTRQVSAGVWVMEGLEEGSVVQAFCGNCPTLPVMVTR